MLPIDPNHEYGNAENAGEKYIIHDIGNWAAIVIWCKATSAQREWL
jgi:hypothetical protein